jgi:protein-tyrosine-phosphatase
MKDIKNVLLVCTGNSCRSIMAEAYLIKRAEEENLSMEVRSAGTFGMDGLTPTKEALQLVADEGIENSGLESKLLTEEMLEWADIVLVMEPEHKLKILEMMPGAENKLMYLGEFNPDRTDMAIPDPIGRTLAFYRASFSLIKQSIEGFLEWLKK